MNSKKQSAESKVKEIRRHTRKKYSAEEKIRIIIEGLRGEISIAELCRREGINAIFYITSPLIWYCIFRIVCHQLNWS
ncbi:hypothetical protein ES708_27484 [subsurface metagenome]